MPARIRLCNRKAKHRNMSKIRLCLKIQPDFSGSNTCKALKAGGDETTAVSPKGSRTSSAACSRFAARTDTIWQAANAENMSGGRHKGMLTNRTLTPDPYVIIIVILRAGRSIRHPRRLQPDCRLDMEDRVWHQNVHVSQPHRHIGIFSPSVAGTQRLYRKTCQFFSCPLQLSAGV